MNLFLKNFGILMVILGVIVLGIYALEASVSNTPLVVAGFLLVGGLMAHVILNKVID